MAFIQYLAFDGVSLPMPDSYEMGLDDVEADSGGETEAGTIQRDVVRSGVVTIPVSFSLSSKWIKRMAEFRRKPRIVVDYFDTEILNIRKTEMFIEGYKASLIKDTSYKGLWKISFTLREF